MKTINNVILIMILAMVVSSVHAEDTDSKDCDTDSAVSERADLAAPALEPAVGQLTIYLDQATIDSINRDPVNPFSERSE